MDEFQVLREVQDILIATTAPMEAARILRYLTDWNKARPMPPAGST